MRLFCTFQLEQLMKKMKIPVIAKEMVEEIESLELQDILDKSIIQINFQTKGWDKLLIDFDYAKIYISAELPHTTLVLSNQDLLIQSIKMACKSAGWRRVSVDIKSYEDKRTLAWVTLYFPLTYLYLKTRIKYALAAARKEFKEFAEADSGWP